MNLLNCLFRALEERSVRFVGIGAWAANHYALSPAGIVRTQDKDLFLPSDAENLLRTWEACASVGLPLTTGGEPLDEPRDLFLARAVVERRALTRAWDGADLMVDLTLVMAGFDFETVWRERRIFRAEGVEFPVARLTHIVASKAAADRPKDRLFLETLAAELREMQRRDDSAGHSG